MTISHVSDTARWVAMYRALETERVDAHFRDPFARRLAGPQGEQILYSIKKAQTNAWPMVVRTVCFDELVTQCVRTDGIDAVLNLACGLDARPYRLRLPESLTWFDVDFPEMVRYKREQLAADEPSCSVEFVGLDLTNVAARRALFARVALSAKRVLVVTEGLLVYLTREQVTGLAGDLHAQQSFQYWLVDTLSPRVVKWLTKRWGKYLGGGSCPFRFGPADGPAFYAACGWKEKAFRSAWEESHRLKREMQFAWLWFLLSRLCPERQKERFRRTVGTTLLERV